MFQLALHQSHIFHDLLIRPVRDTIEQSTTSVDSDMAAQYHGRPASSGNTCISGDGQMTPPSSLFPIPWNESRLQLLRLFRRTKSVKSRSSRLLRHKFRTRPCVTNMREPFPLLLPDSSSATDDESPSSDPSCSSLRRMPVSYKDLRCVSRHRAASGPVTPLLPSPIARDFPGESESYFKFHNPRGHLPISGSMNEDALDELDILSYYCDDNWNRDEESLAEQTSDRETLEDDDQSTASESMPLTPLEHDLRPPVCTDESDWLANTTSHDERMRRFKSRYYQVVQHPWTKIYGGHDEDKLVSNRISLAPRTH